MSNIHVKYRDGSDQKLLDEQCDLSGNSDNEEERESALNELLGISDKHIIDLESDNELDKCDTIECTISDGEENQDKVPDIPDDINETDEVSDNNTETNPTLETHTLTEDEDELEHFKKVFGSNKDKSGVKVSEPVAGTSTSHDHSVDYTGDKAGSSDGQPLLPPPERPKTAHSISKPSRQISANFRLSDMQKRRQKLLRKQVSQRGKIFSGFVITIVLIAMSASLVYLAWKLGLQDLYIIGCIFGAGAVIFVILFIFTRCTAYSQDFYYDSFYGIEYEPKSV